MLKFFAEKMWVAFAVQKILTFFQQKKIRILYIESTKTVNEMTLNELVKLTMLWTTGPWSFYSFPIHKGPDGKLTCTRCKKVFNKQRVFNAHKCVAISDYVDLTNTKDLVNVHSDTLGKFTFYNAAGYIIALDKRNYRINSFLVSPWKCVLSTH